MWIRTASERDLDAVHTLLVDTWHDTYDSIYGAEKVSAISADWHSVAALRNRLTQPLSEFVVADTGNAILGMAFASSQDGTVVHLHQLYVLPSEQGQGAGAALLEEIEGCFPDMRKIRLEVEAENTKAIDFYRANGFEKIGKTDNCGDADSGIPAQIFEKSVG